MPCNMDNGNRIHVKIEWNLAFYTPFIPLGKMA